MDILVDFGERRKIIRIERSCDLLKAVAKQFSLRNFDLERFNERWNTWVDLDAPESVKDGDRLRVVRHGSRRSSISTADTVMVVDELGQPLASVSLDNVADTVSLDTIESSEQLPDNSGQQLTETPEQQQTETPSQTTQQETPIEQREAPDRPQEDQSFVGGCIRRARASLQLKLDHRAPLGRSDWTEFLNAIYDEHRERRGSNYPGSYEELANEVLRRFPWIMGALSPEQAQKNLAHKMQVKFKNKRKRSHSPTVEMVRSKRAAKEGPKVHVPNMPAYMPTITNPVSKDELIINKMREGGETNGMQETFPRRRHEVLGTKKVKAMSMPKLKKRYPRLFCAEECWLEFCRMKGLVDDGTKTWADVNADLEKLLGKISQKMLAPKEEAVETTLRLLGEFDKILVESSTSTQPVIVVTEENPTGGATTGADVFVEGVRVAGCGTLTGALLVWVLCHYVFNQKTKRATKNTNWLVREHILKVGTEIEPEPAVKAEVEALLQG